MACQFYTGCVNGRITHADDPHWNASIVAAARWLSVIDEHFDATSPNWSSIWHLLGLLSGANLATGATLLRSQSVPRHEVDFDPSDVPAPIALEQYLGYVSTEGESDLFGDQKHPNRMELLPGVISLAQDALLNSSLPTLYDPLRYASADSAVAAIFSRWTELANLQSGGNDWMMTVHNLTALQQQGLMDSSAFVQGLGDHSWAYSFAGIGEGGVDHTGYADHLVHIVVNDAYFTWFARNLSTSIAQCNGTPRNQSSCDWLALTKMSLKAEVFAAQWIVLPDAFSLGINSHEDPSLGGLGPPEFRAQECTMFTRTYLNDVFQHQEYVESLGPGTTAVVTNMVERLWHELGDTLLANTWLDQATRTTAMNKWKLMTKNVAYESSWDNDQYGLAITGKWYLDMLAGRSYYAQRLLSKLDLPADVRSPSTLGSMITPFTQNAFYNPRLNSINMLPGLMFFPLFDATQMPFALNVASYGFIIGHEMTHGFDNDGRTYNALGQKVDWWTPQAAEAFDARAQCFVEQYSSFKVLNQSIDGAKTLGENIADNGGLGLAQRVYTQLTKLGLLGARVCRASGARALG